MSELLAVPEILKRLKKSGYKCNRSTFQFYQKLGLIPPPQKVPVKKGRGMIGLYDYSIVERIIGFIQDMQSKGRTLAQIEELLQKTVLKEFKAVLAEWGFSDYFLYELTGYSKEDIELNDKLEKEFYVRKVRNGFQGLEAEKDGEQIISTLAEELTIARRFEDKILNDLKWWFSHNIIEAYALEHISNNIDSRLSGLNMAVSLIHLDMNKRFGAIEGQVSKEQATIHNTALLVMIKLRELELLRCKVNAKISELMDKKFSGLSKEDWESRYKEEEEILEAFKQLKIKQDST